MIMRIELFVKNLNDSAKFYTDVLGFTKGKESDKYISMRNGDAVIGLGVLSLLDDNHYLKPGSESERKGVCVEIVFEVDDIKTYVNKIQNSNYPIETGVTVRPWGATDFRIVDPDGYYIRITSKN